ncbi:MAG: acyl-ACP--UDP-N-acetylglucosamine O-acyltransferase [Candidatus Obscuribacterales bacterium]|nr:acyl-ACP--UDP-N-acetylglucosamine O-acyltransferase [Candidatus Obscuribacterales bacterium]
MTIHKTAIVPDSAVVHETAQIGPYVVLGPNVKIGAGTKIDAHAVIDGHTTIGENCHIFAGAAIGLEPQDLKYGNEPTGVVMGNNVTVREYVTIHRATKEGFTEIGNDCFLMNYVHVAHNCKVGNGVIMANSTVLAGHVEVGDGCVFSGMCVLHQHVRIGRFCMVGGMTGSRVDLPPFTTCDGRPAMVRGLNVIGLRRQKISAQLRSDLKQAYKLLYRSGLNHSQAIARIEEEIEPSSEIKEICQFFQDSRRGVAAAFGDFAQAGKESGAFEEAPLEAI